MEKDLEKLKYPIGKFEKTAIIDQKQLENCINTIEVFPDRLNDEVHNLRESELEKRYRRDGWTIRQVVHHCADSHMNSFIRFKLALTEETPSIKPYHEGLWAEQPDGKNHSIEGSLRLLEGLHARWVYLLRNLSEKDFDKEFFHPGTHSLISLKTNIGIYAWHGEHHLAHIIEAKRNAAI